MVPRRRTTASTTWCRRSKRSWDAPSCSAWTSPPWSPSSPWPRTLPRWRLCCPSMRPPWPRHMIVPATSPQPSPPGSLPERPGGTGLTASLRTPDTSPAPGVRTLPLGFLLGWPYLIKEVFVARRAPQRAEVVSTERITPQMIRVVLSGPGGTPLAVDPAGNTDAYVKVILPRPGSGVVEPFDLEEVKARIPAEDWPVMRTYTIRWFDAETGQAGLHPLRPRSGDARSSWPVRAAPTPRTRRRTGTCSSGTSP